MPASSMEAAVGAATWPVGAQVCRGQIPASTAKPKNITGNAQNWNWEEKWNRESSCRSREPPVEYAASRAISTRAPPKNEYKASFIAPYALLVEPQVAIRKYFGTMTSS